jgi:4-amino-4-deoxy-L-arabinose transferase-like glycosyltransferase
MVEEEPAPAWRNIALIREANGTLPERDASGLRPEGLRTPGYPVFLSAFRFFSGDVRIILVAQCLLGAFLACLIVATATALGLSPRGAFVAGILWALHPALILYDCLLLTESIFNACTVAGVFFATRSNSARNWLLAGVAVGLAGLVRPLGFLYIPFLLIVASSRAKPRLLATIVIIALAILPSLIWAKRNDAVGEGFRVCTAGDMVLFYHGAGDTISEERGEDWLENWTTRCEELSEKLKERIEPGEDVIHKARRLALEEIRARPEAATRVLVKSQLRLMIAHSLGDLYRAFGITYQPSNLFARLILREGGQSLGQPLTVTLAAAWTLLNLILAVGAFTGVFVAFRRKQYILALACAVTIVLFAVATTSHGLERMRLPIMLPIVLLCGTLFCRRAESKKDAPCENTPTQ